MAETIEAEVTTRLSEDQLKMLQMCHPWWHENIGRWKETEDVLYSHVNTKKDDYLPRGEDEEPTTWDRRQSMARFKGELAPVLHRLVGAVFTRPPSRAEKLLTRWKDFISNVDGCHTHIDSFMEDRLYNAWGFGADGILIDRPTVENGQSMETVSENFETAIRLRMVDENEITLVPYRVRQIVNWSVDRRGEPIWLRLCEEEIRQPSPLSEPKSVTVYREYDRAGWRVFEVFEENDKKIGELVGQGSHNLGIVPFSMVGIHRIGPMRYMSPLQNAVSHDIEAFIADADLHWDSWRHAHPTIKHYTSTDTRKRVTIGPDAKVELDPNHEEEMKYLDLPSEVFEVLRQNRRDSAEGVRRLSGVDMLSGSDDAQSLAASGRSRAVSFSVSEERHLRRASRSLAKAEQKIFEVAERWVSDQDMVPPTESLSRDQPNYPQIFSHAGTEALIDQWLATRSEINSEAYDRTFQERIVVSALGDIGHDELEKILQEIRENDLIRGSSMAPLLEEPDMEATADDAAAAIEEMGEELRPEDLE